MAEKSRAQSYLLVGGVVGQPGIPGPHEGTGRPAVAAWWLRKAWLGDDVTDAAAAPATTTDRTRTRKASFIVGYPSLKNLKKAVDE